MKVLAYVPNGQHAKAQALMAYVSRTFGVEAMMRNPDRVKPGQALEHADAVVVHDPGHWIADGYRSAGVRVDCDSPGPVLSRQKRRR